MARFICAALLTLSLTAVALATIEPASAAPPRNDVVAALARGLPLIQKAAERYPSNRTCFSCHHQTMPMLAMVTARRSQREIDEKLLQAQAEFSHKSFRDNHEDLRAGRGIGGKAMTVGYALWALRLADWKSDDTTTALVAYLLKTQHEDGYWTGQVSRPPFEESPFMATVLAVKGMKTYATAGQRDEVERGLAKAKTWLETARVKSQEDKNAKAWGLFLVNSNSEVQRAARVAVLSAQRSDGGWGQTDEMASDAYATGQTLYLLHATGSATTDAAYQHGVEFLLKTQCPDGSWFVKTRSKPIQKDFDNGDPHGKDQFISTPATAWALAALAVAHADEPSYTRTQDVIYMKKGGVALTMDVITPKQGANGAAVIIAVSGGWFSAHEAINPGFAQEFLKRGYTVFAVVHGSQPKYTIPEIFQQMHRAVRFIRFNAEKYDLDPDRIGITGGSAGGHLSLMQGTAGDAGDPKAADPIDRVSSRVQAVACFFPPTDFLNYGETGKDAIGRGVLAGFRAAFDVREMDSKTHALERITDEAKILELGRKISPIYHITRETPPTLIIHGDKDTLVPIQQAESFLAKLKEAGVATELVVKKGAGHGWGGLDKDLTIIADWFDKYLAKEARSKPASAIVPLGAKLEKVWGDGEFTEGPAYGPDHCIYFSDIGNRIMRYDPATGKTTVYRNPSGRANGLDFDAEGRLVACEGANSGGNRRVTRTEKDGSIKVLADRWQGKRLNSPNDLTIDTKGRVYFTDPRYVGDEPREIDTESVYRIDPDGTVTQLITDVQKPNGIILSPDMKTLYLADSNPGGNQHLLSFPLNGDGTVGPKKLLYDFGKGRGIDGMVTDVQGNIYAAAGSGAKAGVYIFNAEGKLLGVIPTPEDPSNCVFGDRDR